MDGADRLRSALRSAISRCSRLQSRNCRHGAWIYCGATPVALGMLPACVSVGVLHHSVLLYGSVEYARLLEYVAVLQPARVPKHGQLERLLFFGRCLFALLLAIPQELLFLRDVHMRRMLPVVLVCCELRVVCCMFVLTVRMQCVSG